MQIWLCLVIVERIDRDKRFVIGTAILGAIVLVLQGVSAYYNIQKSKREREKLELERQKDAVNDKLAELQTQKTRLEIAKLNEEVAQHLRIPASDYLEQPTHNSFTY